MVVVVFGEAAFDGKLLMLTFGIGEADLAFLKDGDDGGMMLQQGEGSHLAWHSDGAGFAFKQRGTR